MTTDDAEHWETVYADNDADEVSWHQERPEPSIELIRRTGVPRDAGIIDVGGGASTLAGHLLRAGYTDLTVADISAGALAGAQAQLGHERDAIDRVVADIREHTFGRRYDVWHDRAVFHFMVSPDDRRAYIDVLRRSVVPGGHVLMGTFGPQGPQSCSGLETSRYDAEHLHEALGRQFELHSSCLHVHETPSGRSQQFLYAHLRRR